MAFRIVHGPQEGAPLVVELPEGTAQTFGEGTLVDVSSGAVVAGTASTPCLGVALAKASGTAGTKIPVAVITPETSLETTWTGASNPTVFASYAVDATVSKLDTAAATNKRFVAYSVDTTRKLVIVKPLVNSALFRGFSF